MAVSASIASSKRVDHLGELNVSDTIKALTGKRVLLCSIDATFKFQEAFCFLDYLAW